LFGVVVAAGRTYYSDEAILEAVGSAVDILLCQYVDGACSALIMIAVGIGGIMLAVRALLTANLKRFKKALLFLIVAIGIFIIRYYTDKICHPPNICLKPL
jgi:uncharacterized membrane protein YfhO